MGDSSATTVCFLFFIIFPFFADAVWLVSVVFDYRRSMTTNLLFLFLLPV
jgi:hypothetical protein